MKAADLEQGTVLIYPYLWFRERTLGETEGRKSRPVSVAFNLGTLIALIPITTQEPLGQELAIEVPDIEKRRAGLDASKRQWLILDELNIDDPKQSFYLEEGTAIGHFSKPFLHNALDLLRQHISRVKQVPRR